MFRSSEEPDELPPIGAPADTPAANAFRAERDRLATAAERLERELTVRIVADLRARLGTHLAAAAGRPTTGPTDPPLREAFVGRLRVTLERTGPEDERLGAWVRVHRDPAAATAAEVAALVARYDDPDPNDAPASAAADRYANVPAGRFSGYADTADRNAVRKAEADLNDFVASSPHAPPRAHVLNDRSGRVRNTVFIRGDRSRRGDEVIPHAVPSILTGGTLVELTDDPRASANVSGRRELAAAIVDPENPLTARVIVNRVWAWRFGTGLVATPSDFGLQGERPSHPELLDWLAAEFVANGWSLKRLHREMLLTDAFRRAAGPAAGSAADPGNRLLARFPRRRLSLEAWRDSVLAACGTLDQQAGGRPVEAFGPEPVAVRTIRAKVNRNDLPGVLRNFDFPSPDAGAAARTETAVPQQALFALNGPHLAAWAEVLAAQTGPDVDALYRRVLLREPTDAERDRAAAFLAAMRDVKDANGTALLAQALLMSNEFAFLE